MVSNSAEKLIVSNRKYLFFQWSLIFIGAVSITLAGFHLPVVRLDWLFGIYSIFIIALGSRLSMQMPGSKVHIMMGDAMIFLIFLLYGGEAAVLVAAAEAFVTSFRLKASGGISTFRTVLFNTAVMACSTGAAYLVVQIYSMVTGNTPNFQVHSEFISFVGILALVQFLVNTTLIAVFISLRNKFSLWQTWSEKCFAGSVTYIAGATAAGVLYKLVEFFNFYAVLVVASAIGVIYLTYRLYIAEINRSQAQADQAERKRAEDSARHIAELNEHIAEQDRISEALRQSKERFQYAAMHDALTGLPNRAFFFEQIRYSLERSKLNSDNGFCVLFMDLDRFKTINDSLGHAVGDKLLIAVAKRLENTIRQGDTVARLSGDEFAIVLGEIDSVEGALNFTDRIIKAISQPFAIEGHQVFTLPSIGIALNNNEYNEPEEILRDADIAMYDAKESRSGFAVFDRELRIRAVNSIRIETDLRYAVEREEFRVFFQPIVSLESGHLVGFEALVRWQHPERGLVSPAEFIPIAESNGQIIPMTNWILWQACSQLSRWRWRSAANRGLLISVNLSSKHFAQPDLVETVKNTLQETGLEARCLKLEITESAVMENAEDASKILESLRSIGVQLSIDDFGTGYSSLSYLHKFPIDTLKVDRSFVSRMGEDGENSEIVRTIITLAHNLGLDVIAEGVETIGQLNKLRELGCRYAQGFLFSKPLPQEEMDEIMKTQRNWLPESVPVIAPRQSNNVIQLHQNR